MTYALITGGLGFIGSFVARQLLSEGLVDKVVVLDHFGRYVSSLRQGFTDYRKLRLEGISDDVIIERGEAKYTSVVSDLLEKYRPKYIFHLAALPLAKLDNLNSQEAREGSVDTTANFLEIINQIKGRSGWCPERFVYASSSMVYGDFQSDVATEDHPTRPKEIYGTMKLAGEIITFGLGRFFDIPVTGIRPSAVYGPTDMNQRVTQIFLDNAMLGKKLIVEGEDVALDFTFVEDIAEGFGLAATKDKAIGEVFNVTAGQAYKLLDYIEILKEYFPDLDCEVRERDSSRPKRGTLSIEKANRMIGYSPRHTLRQGLEKYISFKKENRVTL
jgi:UDP-glucose 4-epimerase